MNRRNTSARIALPLLAAALALGAGCGSTKPTRTVDPELSRTASAARRAFDAGEIEQAARLYRRALVRARAMDDTAEIANLSYNLGLAAIALERYDEGRGYLEEARLEFSLLGEDPVDLEILEVEAAFGLNRTAEAKELAAAGIKKRGKSLPQEAQLQFTLLLARCALQEGDIPAAEQESTTAREILKSISRPEPGLAATAAGVAGEIFFAKSDFEPAAKSFDRQADLLQKSGKYRAAALARGRAGEAYEKAGNIRDSAERYYRGARSLAAQGDNPAALRLIQRALESAGNVPTEFHKRIAGLFEEIKKSLE